MIQYIMNDQDQLSFNFNGKNSRTDFGIIITKSNSLSSPQARIRAEEVPGRNGDIIIDEGGFKNLSLNLECALDSTEEDIDTRARKIKHWLLGPRDYSPLVLSDNPDYYVDAVCSNKLDIEEVIERVGRFPIYFNCKPLRRANNALTVIAENGKAINNPGYDVEPIINIVGSGDITLKIDSQELILKGVTDYITIDCELMDAYRIDNVTKILSSQNGKMYSEFPILKSGQNMINWTGTVTKVEITFKEAVL